MIPPDKIQKNCSEYDIGNYISIEKVPEGVLNDNYILTTTTGRYFIKSVREGSKDKLKTIYSAETLMKDKGVPAIAMLTTKSGDIFVADDTKVYTLYPFIGTMKDSIIQILITYPWERCSVKSILREALIFQIH